MKVLAPGLTAKQRWNRLKRRVLPVKPVILNDNVVSFAMYCEDMEDKYGPGWDDGWFEGAASAAPSPLGGGPSAALHEDDDDG